MQDKVILFVDTNFYSKLELWEALGDKFTIHTLTNGVEACKWLLEGNEPDVIISEFYLPGYSGLNLLANVRKNNRLKDIPFILICDQNFDKNIKVAKELGASDIYLRPLDYSRLKIRLETLLTLRQHKITTGNEKLVQKYSLRKSIESTFAFFLFVLLSPVFLLVATLIKIESSGPVFNIRTKIGKGYKKISDYKFRTFMIEKKSISSYTQLNIAFDLQCPECAKKGNFCSPLLYLDGKSICENFYNFQRANKLEELNSAPLELTVFGKMLKKTKIENLPNLINIIKGDMSFVGEEPWQPEVAERFTNDLDSEKLMTSIGLFNPKYFRSNNLINDLPNN